MEHLYLSVEEIKNKYAPVYPYDGENNVPKWEDTIQFLQTSPEDNQILEFLTADLKEHGTFREPITLESQQERDEENALAREEGEPEDHSPLRVQDGTHRFVTAWLNGVSHIPVRYSDSAFPESPEPDKCLVTSVVFEKFAEGYDGEVLFDWLMSGVRSFPVTKDIWVTSSVMTSSNGSIHISWDNYVDENTEMLMPLISQEIEKRLAEQGIVVSPVVDTSIETW